MPEVSVMQTAAPTTKSPQALNAAERKAQTWQGVAGGEGLLAQAPLSAQPLSRLQPSMCL